jgi:hypothetical protein
MRNNLRPLAIKLRTRAYEMIERTGKPHVQFVPAGADAQFRGRNVAGYVLFRLDGEPIISQTVTHMQQVYRAVELVQENGYGK